MKNSEFIVDGVPITKEEIRAISISKLCIEKSKTFIDIGSGTGSITVEVGYRFPDIEIISIEKNKKAFDLTKRNIEKFNLKNITQILGNAPEDIVLEKKLDAVFLGGSGENLYDILLWSYKNMNTKAKIVANFILIENFNQCIDFMNNIGFKNIEASIINVANMEKLGKGHYFKPINPIYVVSAER